MTNPDNTEQTWPVQDRFLELRSHWLTLIGEHLQDQQGQVLEYWRIEKADSVIVLPIHNQTILLPRPSYRPGVGQMTLDFPGGRVPVGENPEQAAIATLHRELDIKPKSITQLISLNPTGWAVNSSFSNQKLYGFVAHIEKISNAPPNSVAIVYPTSTAGIHRLLQELTCLQCRAVLLEWLIHSNRSSF
jgi:hypothetical protein